jgi:hypothetical protein
MAYDSRLGGCGDLFIYRSNRNESEYITVYIDARAIELSTEEVTLDLAEHPEAIRIVIDVYPDSIRKLGENPYCNDVAPWAEPYSVWQAVSGFVTVSADSSPDIEPCQGEVYRVTVTLEDIVFTLEGETVELASLQFFEVPVGWCAG